MRSTTFMLASALTLFVMTPATASEVKPVPASFDIEKIQGMNYNLQLTHQRQMFETQEMNNRHMKEANEMSLRHMQESQMMHQKMRATK